MRWAVLCWWLACTQSLLHIANDVLDISKLEAEQLTLHPAPLDLCALGIELKRLVRARHTPSSLPPSLLPVACCLLLCCAVLCCVVSPFFFLSF